MTKPDKIATGFAVLLLTAAAAFAQAPKQSTTVLRLAYIPDCGPAPGPGFCRSAPAFLYAEAERRLGTAGLVLWTDGQTLNIAARTQTAEARMTGTFPEGLQPMSTIGELWGASYRLPDLDRSVIEVGLAGRPAAETLVYRGPQAPPEPPSNATLKGHFEVVEVKSAALGNGRKVSVYVPPGTAPKGGWPVVIAADGGAVEPYVAMIDALIETHQIQPTAVVAPWMGGAPGEYLRGTDPDAYSRHFMFVRREALPMAESRFHITTDPAKRILFGVDNGGDWAVQMALRDPGLARQVAAFSVTGASEPPFRSGKSLRLHMAAGAYEGPYLKGSRQICGLAAASGTPCVLDVALAGHAPLMWRAELARVLKTAFPHR